MIMKTAILLLFVLSCTLLGAATLLNESFTSALPASWTMSTPGAHWYWSNTSQAGGSPGELRFSYSPQGVGTFRYISPAFDTRRVHDMVLSFRHMLSDYSTPTETYTIGAQMSTDLTNWTTLWSVTTSSDIAASTVSCNIGFEQGKAQTTYIAFFFTGDTWNVNNWYIDDILLTYANTLGIGTWEAGSHGPVGNLIVPNGYTLQLNAGTSLYFTTDASLNVEGRLLVNGTANDMVLFDTLYDTWKGIKFDYISPANDSSLVNYAVIRNSSASGIHIYYSHKLHINNCRVGLNSNSSGAGYMLPIAVLA